MAAKVWSAAMIINLNFLKSFLIISTFNLSLSLSQLTNSPQNIQTFYPFKLPPLQPPQIPILPSPVPPPPPPPPLPPLFLFPPPSPTTSKKAVATAVGVTAACTLVLSVLFFFLIVRYYKSRGESGGAADVAAAPASRAAGSDHTDQDEFLRFEGNLKGVIVDEDGLDVLYWRKLEGGEGKQSFDKQIFSNIESGEDGKRIIAATAGGGGRKKPGAPVQEIPLLRGKSSTSQHPIWAEPNNHSAPPPPPPPPPESDQETPNTSESGISVVNEERDKTFDGDLMEALFGTMAMNRKSPRGGEDKTSANITRDITGPPSQIFILETEKSKETATVIKSLGVTRKEIIDSLNNGRGLKAETLQKLCRVAPTQQEKSDILAFEGPPIRLADAESFLFYILRAHESAFTRFNAMLMRLNCESEILQVREQLQVLESACDELRGSRLWGKLLEGIAKAGERMISRGNGEKINLKSLIKLSGVKGVDGKTTVLQFVVQEVVRAEGKRSYRDSSRGRGQIMISNIGGCKDDDKEHEYMKLGLPIVGGLSSELPNTKKAAVIDYDSLSSSKISSLLSEIRNLVRQCGETRGEFTKEMEKFIASAESEMEAIAEKRNGALEMVKRTTEYYQRGASDDQQWRPLQLFVIVKRFLEMIDRACVEVSRNLQRNKKQVGVGSSSSTTTTTTQGSSSSRTVRFPKLPADFLSDS